MKWKRRKGRWRADEWREYMLQWGGLVDGGSATSKLCSRHSQTCGFVEIECGELRDDGRLKMRRKAQRGYQSEQREHKRKVLRVEG